MHSKLFHKFSSQIFFVIAIEGGWREVCKNIFSSISFFFKIWSFLVKNFSFKFLKLVNFVANISQCSKCINDKHSIFYGISIFSNCSKENFPIQLEEKLISMIIKRQRATCDKKGLRGWENRMTKRKEPTQVNIMLFYWLSHICLIITLSMRIIMLWLVARKWW